MVGKDILPSFLCYYHYVWMAPVAVGHSNRELLERDADIFIFAFFPICCRISFKE